MSIEFIVKIKILSFSFNFDFKYDFLRLQSKVNYQPAFQGKDGKKH